MGIARSTFYDRPDAGADDATVVAQMKTICDEFETYGYRRVGAELRHRGLVVNAKKVRRLMRMQALNPKQRRRFVMTTDSDLTMIRSADLAANMACIRFRSWVAIRLRNLSHRLTRARDFVGSMKAGAVIPTTTPKPRAS